MTREPVDANARTEAGSSDPAPGEMSTAMATPALGSREVGALGTAPAEIGAEPDGPMAGWPRGGERYLLAEELGHGSMGRIVRAVDRRLARDVAVKVMIGRSGPLAARFEREAMVIARLQHPGIVPIYDLGITAEGKPFYCMKLVQGRNLHDAIRQASAEARMELLPQVLAAIDAVAYAHDQGIIHRDLKPLNVLVGQFGETMVIDWGLAKNLRAPAGESDTLPRAAGGDDPLATRLGQVVGTPAYMPPEQAAGKPVDERADVYALGAMLYHVLAGQPPFAGSEPTRLLADVAERTPVRLAELNRDLPPDLTAIVDKAMARDPADRYPSARELAADLRRYQAGQMVGAHRYTPAQRIGRFIRRNRAAVTATAIMLVGLIAVSLYSFDRVVDQRDQAREAERQASQQRAAAEGMAEFMITDLRTRLEPLGKLAVMEGVGKQVDDYYAAIPAGDVGASNLTRRAQALTLRGDVSRSTGQSEAALLHYEQAAAMALLAGDVDEALFAWVSAGDVRLDVGDLDGAERHFATVRDVAGSRPGTVGKASLRLAMVYLTRGEHPAALQALATAIDDLERALPGHPQAAKVQHNIAVAHGMTSDILWQQNRPAEARAAILRSRAVMEKLVAAEPDNLQWLRGLSVATDRLGDMDQWQGRYLEAEQAFRSSLAVAEKLSVHDPDNTQWQVDLAISLRNVSQVAWYQGRIDEAGALLDRGLQIQEKLAAESPDNMERSQVLGGLYVLRSAMLRRRGRVDEAVASARAAVAMRRAEAVRSPDDAWSRARLVSTLVVLGDLVGIDRPREGLAILEEARALGRAIAAGDDTISEWRKYLAEAELAIARLLARAPATRARSRSHAAIALPMLERLRDAGELHAGDRGLVDEARTLAR